MTTSVFFRPLVASAPIDDSAFVFVDVGFGVLADQQDQYLNAFTAQFVEALGLGQPVSRVRVASNIASLMLGRDGTPLNPGEVALFLVCGADRSNLQMWEDQALAPSTAYIE